MDVKDLVRRYRIPIAFAISLAVVTASFFAGWITMVTSPLFVFLVFKFLGVWRNKERAIYGSSAIAVGAVIFLLVLSQQMANVEVQEFDSYTGNYHIKIQPFATTDFDRETSIVITYHNETNQSLRYEIKSVYDGSEYASGYLNGTVRDGKTVYRLNMTFRKGIYYITLRMGNSTDYGGEVIREYPNDLFVYFVENSVWVILWIIMLYLLLLFGVHQIRRSMELRSLRYE